MIFESFDIYLDGSGHSGTNFLDPDQPVFVDAGWVVPRDRAAAAEVLIRDLGAAEAERRGELLGRDRPKLRY